MTSRNRPVWREARRMAVVGAAGAVFGLGVAHMASGAGPGPTLRIVDDEGVPVSGAVVTVETGSGRSDFSSVSAVIDQSGLQFSPYVSAIPVGGQVRFVNSDRTGHHVYSFSRTKQFEVTVASGGEAGPIVFDRTGLASIGCNIHDGMLAHIYVLEGGPYAVTNGNGVASLNWSGGGELELRVRHPDAKKRRGVTLTVDAGSSDEIETVLEVRRGSGGRGRRDRIEY